MAEQKKDKALEDTIIKWLFDTRYFPDRLLDESLYKGARNDVPYYDEDIFGIFEDGGLPKSYNEARNKVLTRVMNDKNYDVLQPTLEAYNDIYNNGNPQDYSYTSVEDLKRVPIKGSEMDPEEVVRLGGLLASVVSPTDNAKTFLEGVFDKPEKTPEMIEGDLKRNLAKKALNEILSTDAGAHKLYSAFDIPEETPVEDVIDYLTEIGVRAHDIGANAKRPEAAKAVGEFVAPYAMKKAELGLSPNAADVAGDVSQWGGATGISWLNKPKSIIGKAMAGNVGGAGIDYLHDIADSALTKRTFANEGQENEISERGDVVAAIKEFPNVAKKVMVQTPAMLMLGYGGRGIQKIAGSEVFKKAKKKASDTIDRLLGGNRSKVNKEISELEKEQRALRFELDDKRNIMKNGADDIEWAGNKYAENEGKIEKLQKELAKRNALDVLGDVLVTKATEVDTPTKLLNYYVNFAGR